MRKVKILLIDEPAETRLFELLAESLASKDFNMANDACAIRNQIIKLPIHQVPDNFTFQLPIFEEEKKDLKDNNVPAVVKYASGEKEAISS